MLIEPSGFPIDLTTATLVSASSFGGHQVARFADRQPLSLEFGGRFGEAGGDVLDRGGGEVSGLVEKAWSRWAWIEFVPSSRADLVRAFDDDGEIGRIVCRMRGVGEMPEPCVVRCGNNQF